MVKKPEQGDYFDLGKDMSKDRGTVLGWVCGRKKTR